MTLVESPGPDATQSHTVTKQSAEVDFDNVISTYAIFRVEVELSAKIGGTRARAAALASCFARSILSLPACLPSRNSYRSSYLLQYPLYVLHLRIALVAQAQQRSIRLVMKIVSAIALLAGSAAAFAPASSGKFDIFVFAFHHLVLSLARGSGCW